ncbi:nucleoporin Nup43-like [Tropilaelaps mercedesae]|uniref:Nucleoporin Nup43-like n=1 Tax=Tropilaelaps mercedesae TaxID=418985 RepID=A0A1V9XRM6_9ACAR|nr:nucleoporin Nup43-like [Tropilaelaps mercedesae]
MKKNARKDNHIVKDSVIQLWSIVRGDDPEEQCEPQLVAQTSLKGDVAAMEVSTVSFGSNF